MNRDTASLRKRTADGINEVVVFETTLAGLAHETSFDETVAHAEGTLATVENFSCWVDIEAARRIGIRPLPQRVLTPYGYVIITPERIRELAPAELSDRDDIDLESPSTVDRKTIWERKLLDLTVRNRLLNVGRSAQFAEPDICELSRMLDEGDIINVDGMPSVILSRKTGVYHVLTPP